MILARGLSKRFGRLQVLDRLDLDVTRGEVTALVGPNASGKTTFNKILLGLVRRDAGEVFFDGQLVDGDAAYRERIGYMPQMARFPDNLSGGDLVRMLTQLRGARPRDDEVMQLLGADAILDRPLRHLSGGMRQRINAALAFLFAPELLILDEPTAGLDPISSSLLKDKIRRDRNNGQTFIVTSHVLSELEEIADRVAFLLDGRIRFSGTKQELKELTGQRTLERAIALLMRERAGVVPSVTARAAS